MSVSQMQQDNSGVVFISTIVDQDEAVVDLSTATAIQFIFERPDGTILTTNGELATNGTDGKVQYKIESGDLSMVGSWKYQTHIETSSYSLYSNISKFKIIGNLS